MSEPITHPVTSSSTRPSAHSSQGSVLSVRPQFQSVPGRLAVLTPGMGAVATTFFAGVEAIKRGLAMPVGSFTQLGEIGVEDVAAGAIDGVADGAPVGVGERFMKIRELLPLASLDQLVFGGWDVYPHNAYEAARMASVLEPSLLEALQEPLQQIEPMKAVFDREFVRRIEGHHVKTGANKMDLANQLREDIRSFMSRNSCERAVLVWCGSTEVYAPPGLVHRTLRDFEDGLRANSAAIAPSQIYAYAALKERVPYANGSPNVSVEMPCLRELALETGTPLSGSDFKTGQTLLKTVLAPALRQRLLGVSGWFSTNILGNRDGEVLEDPGSFKSKQVSKTSVLNGILSAERYPDLYSDLEHRVHINYYRPRGDNKESWDNIDIFGWLGYPMQIKVNFLCRDSILAAPIVLDLALFMDLAARLGRVGVQDWLSFYFKSPLTDPGVEPEHELSLQLRRLEEAIRLFSQPMLRGDPDLRHDELKERLGEFRSGH